MAEALRPGDQPLPSGTYEAADEAFENWQDREGDDELEAALLAAAPLIRAAERERIRQLALQHGAVWCERQPCTCIRPGSDPTIHSFADLIREPS
jgi:hypothetical protein